MSKDATLYRVPVEVIVHGSSPEEALENLVRDLDYLCTLDQSVVSAVFHGLDQITEE